MAVASELDFGADFAAETKTEAAIERKRFVQHVVEKE